VAARLKILRNKFEHFLLAAKKQQYNKKSISCKFNITLCTLDCTFHCDTYVEYWYNE
jgi:hypothetical protein